VITISAPPHIHRWRE